MTQLLVFIRWQQQEWNPQLSVFTRQQQQEWDSSLFVFTRWQQQVQFLVVCLYKVTTSNAELSCLSLQGGNIKREIKESDIDAEP